MKCDKCGFIANEGDRVCINCGAELRVQGDNGLSLKKIEYNDKTKKNFRIVYYIIGTLLFILVVVLLTYHFLIKR